MEKAYQLFVKWGDELIPVLVLEIWETPYHRIMMTTVIALHGKPFLDNHHKFPLPVNTLTLLASKVIIKGFFLLTQEESEILQGGE